MTVSWDAPTEVVATSTDKTPADETSVNETPADDPPADDPPAEVTGYVVYYSKKNITNKGASGVTYLETTETSVTITGLDNGAEYFVLVTARNAKGEGRASSVKRATPILPQAVDISQAGLSYNDLSVVGEGQVATMSPTWAGLPSREGGKLIYDITTRPEKATAGHVVIDRSTGVVTTTTGIKYLDGGEYTISVRGEGLYAGNKTATLLIKITGLALSKFTATISKLVVTEGETDSSDAPVWDGIGAPTATAAISYAITERPLTASREPKHVSINPNTGVISTTHGVNGNDAGLYEVTISALKDGDYTGILEISFTLVVAIDLDRYALSYSEQTVKLSFSGLSPTGFTKSPQWGGVHNSIGSPATKEGSVKYAITKIEPSNGSKKVKIDPNTGVISASGLGSGDFTVNSRVQTFTITVTPAGDAYVGAKKATFTLRLTPF